MREHARFIELEARLLELEHRLARRTPACEATPDPVSARSARSSEPSRTEPLRSQGDFLAEARTVPPPAPRPAAKKTARGTPSQAESPPERARLERLLAELRRYDLDPQSGLSLERREALRVLLRHDRELDLMNPWVGH
jgi:hypothetical protein